MRLDIRTDRQRQDDRANGPTRAAQRQRARVPGGRAGNVQSIMSYDKQAFDQAAYSDLGNLGDSKRRGGRNEQLAAEITDERARCQCTFCGALLFSGEVQKAASIGTFNTVWHGGTLCCSKGTVSLPRIRRDRNIEALWVRYAKLLRSKARPLNNSLSMASMPVKVPKMPGTSTFQPSVCIEGRLAHKVGTLALPSGGIPAFAQLYVHDPALGDVTDRRLGSDAYVKLTATERVQVKALLNALHTALEACNPYVKDIMTAAEIFREAGSDLVDAVFAIDNTPR